MYRVTQQNWYLLRLMRLHIYQSLHIPVCYSRVLTTRVSISHRALALMRRVSDWGLIPTASGVMIRSYDSAMNTLEQVIRIYADTDVLVLHGYEERFNIWFLRSFSKVYIIDEDMGRDETGHFVFRKIAEKMSCEYNVLNATRSDLESAVLMRRWIKDRSFIEKKYAVSLLCSTSGLEEVFKWVTQ